MASLHPSFFSSSHIFYPTTTRSPFFSKPIKILCALNPDGAESSSESTAGDLPAPVDPVKLAFNKAKAYRESLKSNSDSRIEPTDDSNLSENVDDGGQKEVPMAVKIAMEKAKKYKDNKGIVGSDNSTGENETIQGNIIILA